MKRLLLVGACLLTTICASAAVDDLSPQVLLAQAEPKVELVNPGVKDVEQGGSGVQSQQAPALAQVMPSGAPEMEMHKAVVAVRIDPLMDVQTKAGLSSEDVRRLVVEQLAGSGISVDDGISQPILQLRIRSIEAGFDVATFFQLSLLEESMLVRNRSVFNAITWSQASMLCCRPEDLKKETEATVLLMLQTFIKEYLKSLRA